MREIDLNNGFILDQEQDQSDSFYLTSDDESLLEHFRTAQTEASHFNATEYMSLQSYESGIYNVACQPPCLDFSKQRSTGSLSSNESASDHQIPTAVSNVSPVAIASTDKSLAINCKTLCRDLVKPIANKLVQKMLRKRSTKRQPPQVTQPFKFRVQYPSPISKSNVKLRVVPVLGSSIVNRLPTESNKKLTKSCFSKCGDFVYYNV